MQPLKIIIPGNYWDSFIYEGRLYIFGLEGSIQSIDWNNLIQSWNLPEELRIAFKCAFLRSDYLYSNEVHDLLDDPEVKQIVVAKFKSLAQLQLEISKPVLKKHFKGEQDNPCPFPHSDIEVYNRNMYFSSAQGIFRSTCNRKTRYPISTRPEKEWEGPSLGISASYGSLAIAAGNEGLFEMDLGHGYSTNPREKIRNLSPESCRDCGWTYFSVFASSEESGFLAKFSKTVDGEYNYNADRKFERVETASEIFGSQGYSWGVQDKLCQAYQNEIKIMRYSPWGDQESESITNLGSVKFDKWKGNIISATTTNFGVIVELENAIVVFPSKGQSITLKGEPVNWRTFPRSKHYENQLHIIYNDRLEIFSFNQDYLLAKEDKILGTTVSSNVRRWGYGRQRQPEIDFESIQMNNK